MAFRSFDLFIRGPNTRFDGIYGSFWKKANLAPNPLHQPKNGKLYPHNHPDTQSPLFYCDDDDDEGTQKRFFKLARIRLGEHAPCQLLAVTTPCGKDFYY